MKIFLLKLIFLIFASYNNILYGIETPIIPFEIKGSGLSSPFFLTGLERFSYHTAQENKSCGSQKKEEKDSYDQFIKRTGIRDDVDLFLEMFPYLKKNPLLKSPCTYTEVIWPSFEFSKTYMDLIGTDSEDEIAIQLIHHIGDVHVFLSQFKIGHVHHNRAIGIEAQESISILVFNNIKELGLESVQVKRQRILNAFYAYTHSLNTTTHIGVRLTLSQLSLFEQTSAITDISALKSFGEIRDLREGYVPSMDVSFSWRKTFGLAIKNLANRPYKRNLFDQKIADNQRSINLSLASPQYSIYGMHSKAAIDLFQINNPKNLPFLNRLHMGIQISKNNWSWSTGLNQGNITNSLRTSFYHHEVAIGHIGYDHDEDLGFRRSERIFITAKSRF